MPLTAGFTSKKDFSKDKRKQLAKEGKALPDGSYPIENGEDLKHAVSLAGMGNDPKAEIKAHIIARARDLGLVSSLPASWSVSKCEMGALTSKKAARRTAHMQSGEIPQPRDMKKPKQSKYLQTVPMNVSAISSSLSNANS